jgi:hypothetical protein
LLTGRLLPLLFIPRLILGGWISAAAESIGITRTVAVGVFIPLTAGAESQRCHCQNHYHLRSHAGEGDVCTDCSAFGVTFAVAARSRG